MTFELPNGLRFCAPTFNCIEKCAGEINRRPHVITIAFGRADSVAVSEQFGDFVPAFAIANSDSQFVSFFCVFALLVVFNCSHRLFFYCRRLHRLHLCVGGKNLINEHDESKGHDRRDRVAGRGWRGFCIRRAQAFLVRFFCHKQAVKMSSMKSLEQIECAKHGCKMTRKELLDVCDGDVTKFTAVKRYGQRTTPDKCIRSDAANI